MLNIRLKNFQDKLDNLSGDFDQLSKFKTFRNKNLSSDANTNITYERMNTDYHFNHQLNSPNKYYLDSAIINLESNNLMKSIQNKSSIIYKNNNIETWSSNNKLNYNTRAFSQEIENSKEEEINFSYDRKWLPKTQILLQDEEKIISEKWEMIYKLV